MARHWRGRHDTTRDIQVGHQGHHRGAVKRPARIHDRDPALTLRRALLVVNAVGESVPQKVVDWIVTTIDGTDGDILKIKAFAVKACSAAVVADDDKVLPSEAVAVIRDVCVRRLMAGSL